MVRKVLYPAVFVLVVLMTAPALAGWTFWSSRTATLVPDGVDAQFYLPDTVTLVQTGAFVQFIVALDGGPIVDPLEFFDYDLSGAIEPGVELDDVSVWVQAGADPAAISGGMNVLCTASDWDGTTTLSAPGFFNLAPESPYIIDPGDTFDKIAFRAWNLTPEELEKWCNFEEYPEMVGVELLYLTGRELGTHDNRGGGPDTGWWISYPGYTGGGAPAPEDWAGFSGLIGYEIYAGHKTQNTLDKNLGTCIPEPGTMLLIGSAVLLLLIRRKK